MNAVADFDPVKMREKKLLLHDAAGHCGLGFRLIDLRNKFAGHTDHKTDLEPQKDFLPVCHAIQKYSVAFLSRRET